MKLRIYSSILTGIVSALVVTIWMWCGTTCDLLELIGVNMMIIPIAGLSVMALTEDKPPKKRICKIYSLDKRGEWHEERI